MLASGEIVTANACQYSDLFASIRGGGGGTYAIVVSTTVKAYPSAPVVAQVLAMAPLTDDNIPDFMDALTILYGAFPELDDGGYSGYGSWNVQYFEPVFANFTTGYQHAMAVFNQSVAAAEALFSSISARLEAFNGTRLFISTSYISFPSYAAYYATLSGAQSAVGINAALGSRLLDKVALTGSASALRKALNIIAGLPGQYTGNNVCLVSGGQVFKDASDPNSGVNPAWRTSYVHHIVSRGWSPGTDLAAQTAIHNDITYTKVGALRTIAPNTGAYMNEGDRLDPTYLQDFYGEILTKLQAVKQKYDYTSVFYCPTCVGSDQWREDATGRLCRS